MEKFVVLPIGVHMNNKDDQIKTLYRRLEDLSKLYIDDNVYKEIESVLDQLD